MFAYKNSEICRKKMRKTTNDVGTTCANQLLKAKWFSRTLAVLFSSRKEQV